MIKSSRFSITGKTTQNLGKEITDMLELGLIQQSNSPWSFTIALVPKDGSIKLCVDYGKLSTTTVSDVCLIPRMDEILTSLKVFGRCL